MNQSFVGILALLVQQKDIQEELLNLSYEKRQVIVRGDTDRLNEIVQIELKSLSKMNILEKKRDAELTALENVLGVPKQEISISFLIEKANVEEKNRLITLQRELAGILSAHTQLNKINQDLLNTQLDYTDVMLTEIVGVEDPLNNFYGDDGKTGTEKRRQSTGLFDKQI